MDDDMAITKNVQNLLIAVLGKSLRCADEGGRGQLYLLLAQIIFPGEGRVVKRRASLVSEPDMIQKSQEGGLIPLCL